jgi:hypothetical protein
MKAAVQAAIANGGVTGVGALVTVDWHALSIFKVIANVPTDFVVIEILFLIISVWLRFSQVE